MPLEIRELIIKATVSGGQGSSGGNTGHEEQGEPNINEIVDKVLEIIKQKRER